MIRIRNFAAALLLAASTARAGDVKVTLQHQFTAGPSVPVTTIGGTDWKDAPAEKLLRLPKFKGTPKWGELLLDAGTDKSFAVVLDDAGAGEDLLYVDANNNEDLTDDGEPAKQYTKEATSLGKYWKLAVEHGKKVGEYQMYVYAWDSNTKGFQAYRGMDWFEGKATLAGQELRFAIVDMNSNGRFDDLEKLALCIDYNADGKYDGEQDSNERYNGDQPFGFADKGWVLKSVSEAGDEAVIAEHSEAVAIRPPLGPGAPAPDFTGTDKDGNEVSLSSFQGKVVLVQFWSTASGDQALALDQHKKIWEEYKDKGYMILGVNLDADKEKAQEFAASHEMTWPIVYDGQMLEGDIAKQFRLYTYPRLYLVDADGVIRDNSLFVGNLEKVLGEMLSDADAEPLTAAKPADLAGFMPKVDKGDWWLVFHQRRADYDGGEFLLYMVMEASAERLGLIVSSTSGWSYALGVDRETWNVVTVNPTYTDWDQKAEKIRIAPEKDRRVEIQGSPSVAMLRQFPNFDVLFHSFPGAASGTLTCMIEQPGGPTSTETAPLECSAFIDANGRLIGKYKASLNRHVLRIKQTWEQGLPFPRRVTYSNSITGARGVLILCRAGKKVGLAFPSVPDARRIVGMDSSIDDPPVSRCPSRNFIGEDAVAAACAKLAPGKPTQSLDIRGEGYWKRGDIMKVYWQVRSIPKVLSGPKPAQSEKLVEIPVSGIFILECVDMRRVGDEDLIFVQAYGEDTRMYSYDTNYAGMQGQQGRTIADLLSGTGPAVFSNPEYWTDPDPKKAKWDRIAYLRARRYYGGYSFNSATTNGKQCTTWILALRRDDLSLRAAYGYHLDANLKAGEFGISADQFKNGPAFVRQSLQLVRPQDWLIVQAFAGLKNNVAKGNVLNLSPQETGFFRNEMLKDEDSMTQLVKNDKFFSQFSELLAKRSPPPDAKNGKKRQAKVSLTEGDVAKLEGGFANGDYSGVVRRLEEGAPKRDLTVFRTTNGPGLWVYQGFSGTFSWWRETLVLNWKEGYLARLRMYVPVPPKPGS